MEKVTAGKGHLRFEKMGTKTVVTQSYSKSPLKILTPKNNGKTAWAYSTNFGGGFVGGDSIEINLHVSPEAEAVFLSQASTKVYGSEEDCHQLITGHVANNGKLFSLPDPVVCFKGAKFNQKQVFNLEENASLVMLDTLHCGREHAGERWAFDSYVNKVQIMKNNKCIFFESLKLDSSSGDLNKRQGRFNALSLLLLMGPAFQKNGLELMNRMSERRPNFQEDLVCSVSPLDEDGVVMRLASTSTETLSHAIREILYFLPEHLGDDPWLRKW